MRLVNVDSLYRHLFTCSDGRICPDTDIDNWPIQFDVKTIKKIIRKEPIVFDIPDNATNGDVAELVWGFKPRENTCIIPKTECNGNPAECDGCSFDDWWNIPYQKGGTNEQSAE